MNFTKWFLGPGPALEWLPATLELAYLAAWITMEGFTFYPMSSLFSGCSHTQIHKHTLLRKGSFRATLPLGLFPRWDQEASHGPPEKEPECMQIYFLCLNWDRRHLFTCFFLSLLRKENPFVLYSHSCLFSKTQKLCTLKYARKRGIFTLMVLSLLLFWSWASSRSFTNFSLSRCKSFSSWSILLTFLCSFRFSVSLVRFSERNSARRVSFSIKRVWQSSAPWRRKRRKKQQRWRTEIQVVQFRRPASALDF